MWGSGGPPIENIYIFELRRLDFLQFQHDFRSLKGRKAKPFSGGGGNRGWAGSFGLSSIYMLKNALLQRICSSGIDPTSYTGHFAYNWERELDHLHHTAAKDNDISQGPIQKVTR